MPKVDEVSITQKYAIYLYITFFTALITSLLFGNHYSNKTGEYGAGVSAVLILIIGASK